MRQTLLICRRQLGMLFRSPMAYVVLTLYLLCCGFFFRSIVYERSLSISAMKYAGSVPASAAREFWNISGWLTLFVVPIVTMGSLAGEKTQGTIELLLSSPIKISQIILGKYLSLTIFLAIMLAPTGVYFYFLRQYGGLAWSQIVAGYMAAFLLGTSALSLGILVSALTKNQIIAAFGTFGSVLIFWFIDAAGNSLPSYGRTVVRYLSLNVHYGDLMWGKVGVDDVVYFVSFAVFFLAMAHTSIQVLWNKGKWS